MESSGSSDKVRQYNAVLNGIKEQLLQNLAELGSLLEKARDFERSVGQREDLRRAFAFQDEVFPDIGEWSTDRRRQLRNQDWKVFSEVLRSLDSQCTDSQLDTLQRLVDAEPGEPGARCLEPAVVGHGWLMVVGQGLESALKWVFSGPRGPKRSASLKKKKTNEELETLIEVLRVRTASGAVILTLDSSSSLAVPYGFLMFLAAWR
eukprot:Skav202383  [mRNA]  locus=scaffold1406:341810:346157:- [translate_table: standard]